ncbi:MAG: LysR family transcriptional regulator [Oscillospiraceae bacterium]|nr:LysR family transcriptional regulator [Oscillospiraceae bacterium]
MEILQLKYFSHAAKCENFSHTAKKFCVPTSCVSASVKKLEKEIGVSLFDRTANTIKLNEYGKIFLSAVTASEELFKKAETDILELRQMPFGELKLLILTNRQKVTEVISEFKIKYPQISFNIKHQWQDGALDIGEYDIVVSDFGIPDIKFDKKFWLHEEIFLAVHKENPLSRKKRVSADEMKNEKFVSMERGSSLRRCADKYLEGQGIKPDIVIECDDPRYIRNYLKMGLGVTFFPGISWKKEVDGEIRLLHIGEGLYRDSYIYLNKTASNMARLFAKELEER